MKRQSGFTLVEIAIVLVVIGLLLGGVLKGQELVLNAQIRNSINDYNNVASARFAYQDRYRRIPGDDDTANARWGATAQDGDGDGNVAGNWDANAGGLANETGIFWHHLRNDNLIAGSRDANNNATFTNPQNAFNGQTGVQQTAFANAMLTDVICQSAIPARAATLIDIRIDDGAPDGSTGGATGGLMAGTNVQAAAAADYTAAVTTLIMCREL